MSDYREMTAGEAAAEERPASRKRSQFVERYEIKLQRGTVLQMLWDGEGHVYGYLVMQPDGRARIWRQTWVEEYAPTEHFFPGFVSAVRALLDGVV